MSQTLQNSIGLIIVAAGRGERAGTENGPKQYRKLGNTTVIAKSIEAFSNLIPHNNMAIVIHADDHSLFSQATANITTADCHIVDGGPSRQESVFEGLKALTASVPHISHVMIHDAARPFVREDLLWRILETASAYPDNGILPTIAVTETLKTVDDDLVTGTASRSNMHRAQTPQTFPIGAIFEAHQKAANQGKDIFTDDAALFEWVGLPVRIVEGDPDNIKLTYKSDFPQEETYRMTSQTPDIRTGNGYDVHRFGDGDKVVLCGIEIPFTRSLSGHSDADVGLHALTDALLATCGAGDIGDHFPPTDPQWKGMASHVFLSRAVKIVHENGGTIMNADVTLICEAPKIAPHRLEMREKLSSILGIDLMRCSVKATTNERMGFVGREEGIAAIATASVAYGVIK